MKLNLIFPLSIIFLYPFSVYALQNDVSINSILLVIIAVSGYIIHFILNFKYRFTLVQVTCFFIIISIIVSFFIGNILVSIFIPDFHYYTYTSSIYFISIILFYLVLIESITLRDIDFLLGMILFVSLIVAIFIFLQFALYFFYDVKIYPPFCNELNCTHQYLKSPKYGYAGGYARPSGFFNSTNRVASYLIPSVFISIYFYKKNKNLIYSFLSLFFILTIVLNLSRSGIISLAIAIIFYYALSSKEKKLSLMVSLLLVITAASFLFFLFFIFLYTTGSGLNYKFNFFYNFDLSQAYFLISNFFSAIQTSLSFIGFGVGYDVADEYLYQMYNPEIWGSHSNLIQIIVGIGILPSSVIIISLFQTIYKSIKFSLDSENGEFYQLGLLLSVSLVGILLTGILRTYALNYYAILILAITYIIMKSQSITSEDQNVNN